MRYVIFSVLLCGLAACSGKSDTDKVVLEEAARYHNEATEVQEQLEPMIDRIDSVKTRLALKTTPEAKAITQSLDSLKTAFETWEENLVEVPGMKHEHHEHGEGEHHHHHHHNNNDTKDMPADQLRDLQREFLANIKLMQQQTQQAMDRAKGLL
ncbi:hypothetical protein IC229_11460 [Spirosoma sp. BT702]|uniref:Uncharacterized protein n=1 Tax=Spirosoma profusum TaxID=2771354 RepID=A0A926XVI5_9BACT|nr:hypothetical protein [Spirosoma profusum]MBD2701257.1 hypothetical protein [Spirosoma profusum]